MPTARLVSVSYQPTNFAFQRQRTLSLTLNANGRIGKMPPPPPPGRARRAAGAELLRRDRADLQVPRPAAAAARRAELDLLDGDTITGVGTSRAYGYVYGGINYNGFGVTFDGWYSGPSDGARRSPGRRLALLLGAAAQLRGLHAGPPRARRDEAWTKGMRNSGSTSAT